MIGYIKDFLLMLVKVGINYFFAIIYFQVFSIVHHFLLSEAILESDIERLLGKMNYISSELFIYLGFLYFVFIDYKTLMLRDEKQIKEFELYEKFSTKGKLFLNKTFNVFLKVPFENSFKDILIVYLLRNILVIIFMLPIYLFELYGLLMDVSSMVFYLVTVLLLVILLGSALLYLYDTTSGKWIERLILKYVNIIRPDSIEDLKKEFLHNKRVYSDAQL